MDAWEIGATGRARPRGGVTSRGDASPAGGAGSPRPTVDCTHPPFVAGWLLLQHSHGDQHRTRARRGEQPLPPRPSPAPRRPPVGQGAGPGAPVPGGVPSRRHRRVLRGFVEVGCRTAHACPCRSGLGVAGARRHARTGLLGRAARPRGRFRRRTSTPSSRGTRSTSSRYSPTSATGTARAAPTTARAHTARSRTGPCPAFSSSWAIRRAIPRGRSATGSVTPSGSCSAGTTESSTRAWNVGQLKHPATFLPQIGEGEWPEQRLHHVRVLRTLITDDGPVPTGTLPAELAVVVLGAVMVADWMASETQSMRRCGASRTKSAAATRPCARHWKRARKEARARVKQRALGRCGFAGPDGQELLSAAGLPGRLRARWARATAAHNNQARGSRHAAGGALRPGPPGRRLGLVAASRLGRASGARGIALALPEEHHLDEASDELASFGGRASGGLRRAHPPSPDVLRQQRGVGLRGNPRTQPRHAV